MFYDFECRFAGGLFSSHLALSSTYQSLIDLTIITESLDTVFGFLHVQAEYMDIETDENVLLKYKKKYT